MSTSSLSVDVPHKEWKKHYRGSKLHLAVVGSSELAFQIGFECLRVLMFRSVKLIRHSDERCTKFGYKAETVDVVYPEDSDEPHESLLKAIHDKDIVISCMGGTGLGRPQIQLAKAAKAGGCKLFVPSDYCFPPELVQFPSLMDSKKQLHALLQELKMPSLTINCGMFPEVVFHPQSNFGFDIANGKARIVGDGNQPCAMTTVVDVARALSHLLKTRPPEELAGQQINIQGERKTLREVVEIVERRTKTKMEVVTTSLEQARLQVEQSPNPSSFNLLLGIACAEGWMDVTKERDDSKLWPQFYPATVEEALRPLYRPIEKKKK